MLNVMNMIKCKLVSSQLITIPIVLSIIAIPVVHSHCIGGIETFEKSTRMVSTSDHMDTLLRQPYASLTRDCVHLCRQQTQCQAFGLNYAKFICYSYPDNSTTNRDQLKHSVSANHFRKICLNGITRPDFHSACGPDRLWAYERVNGAFIEGFVGKQLDGIDTKDDCLKWCLIERNFICRSVDYDSSGRMCRLSTEDRRTQPQTFRRVDSSARDYFENQCAPRGGASCVFRTEANVSVLSMDSLHFSQSVDDCRIQCYNETAFKCRAFSFLDNRCSLSADDAVSRVNLTLPTVKGAVYGERTCQPIPLGDTPLSRGYPSRWKAQLSGPTLIGIIVYCVYLK